MGGSRRRALRRRTLNRRSRTRNCELRCIHDRPACPARTAVPVQVPTIDTRSRFFTRCTRGPAGYAKTPVQRRASMPTTTFDPMADPFLEDPYPQFRRFVGSQPVFWSAELGLLGGVSLRRRTAGAARARDLLGLECARATAPAVPRGESSTGRRWLSLRSDPHERRSARPHPGLGASPTSPSRRGGWRRWRTSCATWSAASSPSDFTRDGPRSCRRSPGSCLRSWCSTFSAYRRPTWMR